MQYSSSFGGALLGYEGVIMPPFKGRMRTHTVNITAKYLYQIAYGEPDNSVLYGRVIVESRDSNRISCPPTVDFNNWYAGNTYCYENVIDSAHQPMILQYMRQDLDRYLGYKVYWQKRKAPCLVLTKEGNVDLRANKDSLPFIRLNAGSIRMVNKPYSYFVAMLQHFNQKIPLLDETGIADHNISISLKADLTDPEMLDKALQTFGLRIHVLQRETNMLIITDK